MANFQLNKTSRINPLYVGGYNFDKTIDKLNEDSKQKDIYAASIRDTNALNPDQSKKNSVFRQHQDELNSVLNDTTSEPAVQRKNAMTLAAKHANDLDLRAFNQSVEEKKQLHKELENKDYAVNADYDKALSDAAFERAGGTTKNAFGGHNTYEKYRTPLVPYVDPSKKREEVGSGFKIEGEDNDANYYSNGQGQRIKVNKNWKGVLPQEVYDVAESSYRNDPSFFASEKKIAERQAVEDLKTKYPDANLADIRDMVNNPNFKQKYSKSVPELDSNGSIKKDSKGNRIYKTETIEDNPLNYNLENRKKEFAKQTATKFGGLETGRKVDERDDAVWMLNYKRKMGKEDSFKNAPTEQTGQETNTGWTHGINYNNIPDDYTSFEKAKTELPILKNRRTQIENALKISGSDLNKQLQLERELETIQTKIGLSNYQIKSGEKDDILNNKDAHKAKNILVGSLGYDKSKVDNMSGVDIKNALKEHEDNVLRKQVTTFRKFGNETSDYLTKNWQQSPENSEIIYNGKKMKMSDLATELDDSLIGKDENTKMEYLKKNSIVTGIDVNRKSPSNSVAKNSNLILKLPNGQSALLRPNGELDKKMESVQELQQQATGIKPISQFKPVRIQTVRTNPTTGNLGYHTGLYIYKQLGNGRSQLMEATANGEWIPSEENISSLTKAEAVNYSQNYLQNALLEGRNSEESKLTD